VDTARSHRLTPAAVLAAAYAEVLSAYSGADRLTLNSTLFQRDDVHPDIDLVLGDFTALLLVGYEAEPGESWLDTTHRLQRDMWEGMQHSSVSALWVLRELARHTASDNVAMPIVFTSAIGIASDLVNLRFPFGSLSWGISQTPQVWLDNQVMERDGGLSVNWDSVDALFPQGLPDAMFGAYRRLLDWLATGDWKRPAPELLPASQRDIRARVNDTARAEPWHTLHERVFQTDPGRVALIHGGVRRTYGDLTQQALRIAGELARRGIGAQDAVAVTLPRGPDQIAAVLGILAAGAVYVPVGVEQPASRRDRIYARAGVRAVVGGDVPATPDGPPAAPVRSDPGSLAYVIFTSGSTGEPKGVEITHAAAVNTIDDINTRYGIGPGDRVLAISALDFDLSVYDIFGLLAVGGALVLIDDEETREARRWAQLIAEHRVTVWNSVPALLEMLLTAAGPGEVASLRTVLASGDWVGLDLPGKVRAAAPAARFVALGGATEASIWSNACEVDDVPAHWQSIPYGLPLANQSYRVVDSRGRQCPDWVTGELLIGGAGVARGYRGAPELTAAQFPTDAEGRRWYRTGDHGRYWPDGTLEFLGRRDSRVKIRGHRIELGELEAVAAELAPVERAVAVTVGEGASAQLALAVIAGEDSAVLRRELAARLPAYLLPEHLAVVDQLPLSPNGKVDRAAVARLFNVDAATPQDEPPAGPAEQILAGLLAELLGIQKVGRHRSFFALGGDSLLATRLVEQIRLRFGVELTLRRLLAAPTVAGLAGLVGEVDTDIDEGEI
jgi:amino acid adenylation domain-containing protein